MMDIKKTINRVILSLGILLLANMSVHAGFGVSPSNIDSQYLKPGATFKQEFTLSRSENLDEMIITIAPALGEMESWFTYTPGKTFTFERGQSIKTFEITVKVPNDAQYQNYNGVIRITATPANQDVAGVTITQGVRLDAGLTVTDADYSSLSILSIKALETQDGEPIKIEIVGENKGNVDAKPSMKVTIMNLLMEVLEVHEIEDFGTIKPNEKTTLVAQFVSNLPVGEYFVNVQVLLDGNILREERLVLNIVTPPPPQQEEKEEPKTAFNIGSILESVKEQLPYLVISLLIIPLAYLILEKIWSKQSKTVRLVISVILGMSVLLGIIFAPLLPSISIFSDMSSEEYIQSLPYIFLPIFIFITSYLVLEKIWKKQKSKTLKNKLWAILLGSKKYSRTIFSFLLSLLTLLLVTLLSFFSTSSQSNIDSDLFKDKVEYVFDNFTNYIPYLIFSLMSVIVTYLLLEKIWKKSNMKELKGKWWAFLLGCDKYSRLALSVLVGILIFLLAVSYTLISFKTAEQKIEVNSTGETQGVSTVQDSNPLKVNNGYAIYKTADISSDILYKANEGEEFKVLSETDTWFEVELQDGSTGWLQKTIVKDVVKEER